MTANETERAEGLFMRGVSYSVGERRILNRFDLEVRPGENRTILGVSGVGKTTILKLLLGLLTPDEGEITINGVSIKGMKESRLRELRRNIAIVFQGGALFDSMTVGENVGYRLLESGIPVSQAEPLIREKLSFVGLESSIDLYPAELSGGMKKRVAIARALAADPDYILFDEPTTGLDPIGVYNIQQLMKKLQQERTTTLMVTHDLQTAFAVSDQFTFIHEGESIYNGNRAGLESSTLPAVRQFFSPGDSALFVYNERTDNRMKPDRDSD